MAKRGTRRTGRRLRGAPATPLNRKRGWNQAMGAVQSGVRAAKKAMKVYRAARTVHRTITRVRNRTFKKPVRSRAAGGSGQISFITKKYGKRMSTTASSAMKLARLADDEVVFRWQNTNPYAMAYGAKFMSRAITGTPGAANAKELLPLDIYDLSGVLYNIVGLTNPDIARVSWQLNKTWTGITTAPVQYKFDAFGGENNLGGPQSVTGSIWTIEKATDANVNNTTYKRDLMKWLDLKLMCIGSTSIPTRFTIELVHLLEDCLHPTVDAMTWTGSGNINALWTRRNQFWENEILRYTDGPTASLGNRRAQSKMKKVLHSISFVIQPKTSIELDQEGDYKIVKIFKWLNKLCIYDWLQSQVKPFVLEPEANQPFIPGTTTRTTATETDAYAIPENVAYNTFTNVELKKRLYLIVKAEAYYPGQTTDVKCVPSYDLTIRKGHTVPKD